MKAAKSANKAKIRREKKNVVIKSGLETIMNAFVVARNATIAAANVGASLEQIVWTES